MTYTIRQGKPDNSDFTFYGGAKEFIKYKGPEAIISGPAETGKTISALYKLYICACKYPNASIVIARKTLASTYSTVLQTFQKKVLSDTSPVKAYGGEKPEWFQFHNGSRIWMAGLDKSSKVLSAEHDLIYVNQAEELTLDDWETLLTRVTGRAGNMPYSQLIGDMNPTWPSHWIYSRESLKLFYSFHNENPVLYNQVTGQITEQGQKALEILSSLTGVRRKRLYEGLPAQAEGMIYVNWNDATHLVDIAPKCFRHVASVDWGFKNPGVIGIWGIEGKSGDMYLVAQIYSVNKTFDWWLERAVGLDKEFRVEAWACDPSQPEYIERLKQRGLNAVPAYNKVLPGIDAVTQRIDNNGLFIVRDCLRYQDQELINNHKIHKVEQEFPGYVWANTRTKEQPVKENDHGMDMMRYAVAYVDKIGERTKRDVRPLR